MKVDFLDIKRINNEQRAAFTEAYNRVMDSGWFILGNEVKQFEAAYAAFNGVSHAIGVANGLDALILSLRALGIGAGDEVIVPSNTYIASWLAVSYTGARPVPVEPDPFTYNIDPSRIEEKISPATRAIMPVHLYGQSAAMDRIQAVAQRHGLAILEDNAQAQGARCNNRLTATWGIINATSFYPGKNLGALGDAGAVTTDDAALAEKVTALRNYGSHQKYYNEILGVNSRLDEMQAAFLSVKLPLLNAQNQRRQQVADRYNAVLAGVGDLILPVIAEGCTSVYHLYVVRTAQRDALQEHLRQKGIGTMIHYPVPPHLQQAYAALGYQKGDFPIAEQIADTAISLPMAHYLEEAQIAAVAEAIQSFF